MRQGGIRLRTSGFVFILAQGYCYAAGMAQLEDGNFYAAAPVADEVPRT